MQPQRPVTLLNTTSDTLFAGQLRLFQPAKGHRAGTDAVLLAAACPPARRIADVGAGVGTAGLRAAQMHPGASIVLIEREAELAKLATRNLAENALSDRGAVLTADILAKGFGGPASGPCDVVLTNPPFDEAGTVRVSPDRAKSTAHVLQGSFEAWLKAALCCLSDDGVLIMIHRADALPRILAAAQGRLGGLAIMPVHPSASRPASRVLIKGKRGSKAPLQLLPPLILHGPDGQFTPAADAIHRGAAAISL